MRIFVFNFKKIAIIVSLLIFCIILGLLFLSYKKIFFAIESASNSVSDTLAKSDEKIAYLTFDDGPTLRATGKILDILKEENVKASFFVIGKYVAKHPELVKRAYDEGHYIANHGYSHDNSKLYKSNESFLSEVKNTDIEIGKAIDVPDYCSHYFRFPNGFMSSSYRNQKNKEAQLLYVMGYMYVDWNCLNKDSEKKCSQAQLLSNLKKTSKNKGTLIILMHDTCDVNDTVSVLKDSILYLKSQEYEFKNFYDLDIQSQEDLK